MKLRLTARIVLYFVLLAAVLLTTVGLLAYRSGSEDLKKAAVAEVLGKAIEKEAVLTAWIDERLADLRQLSSHAALAERTASLHATTPGTDEARLDRARVRQELEPYVSAAASGFTEVFMIDPESGVVVASTNPAMEGKVKIGHPYFDNGKTDLFLQAPYYSEDVFAAGFTAAAPLRGSDGRVQAVVAARINLAEMNGIALRRTGLSETEDAFLFNAQRFLVTQPRFIRDPAVLVRQMDTEAVRRCVARNSGVTFAPDYRGVPSIAVYRWNARQQLGLIVKVDQAEALAPARAFAASLLWTGALALLATVPLAFLLARTITGPLRMLHNGVRKFGDGEWQARVNIRSGDELGEVARAFNQMAAQLEADRASLRTLQQFQDAILKSIGQGIYGLDLQGQIIFENPAAARTLGWEVAELVGQPAHATFHQHRPDGSCNPVTECRIHATLRDGQFRQVGGEVFWRKDGTSFPVEYSVAPLRDSAGAITGAVVVFADITERKVAEAALRESEGRMRLLVSASHVGLWDWNLGTNEVFFSEEWKGQLGYTDAELPSRYEEWEGRLLPEDREPTLAAVKDFVAGRRENFDIEFRLRHKDETWRWIFSSASLARDATGQPVRVMGCHIDITERKQAEAALAKANEELVNLSRQAGMSEIATSVLHNVGNVLTSVNVSAELLREHVRKTPVADLSRVVTLLQEHGANLSAFFAEDPRGAKLPEFLARLADHFTRLRIKQLEEVASLQKNVEHIKEIVAMQQSYARISGVTESLQVTDLVEDALRMIGGSFQRHAVQVVREFAPGLPAINTERHKVLQILVNLLGNARHACDSAGHGEKRITVRVSHADGRMRVEVSDNGVGIAAENLDRIFNHGFTTKKAGHGFGLHSAANAAGEMGGSLTVRSDGPSKGATFTLELPVNGRAGTPPAIDANHATPPLHA